MGEKGSERTDGDGGGESGTESGAADGIGRDGDATAGDFEAYLAADGVEFDGDDAALLRAIAAEGSVSAAAATLGRSRARALNRIETLEAAFGPLVERRRGGSGGGGSRPTEGARELLARFDRLRAALSGTAGAGETVIYGTLVAVAGELGTVKTAAGTVRSLVADRAIDPDAAASGGEGEGAEATAGAAEVGAEAAADTAEVGAEAAADAAEVDADSTRAADTADTGDAAGDAPDHGEEGSPVQVSVGADAVTLHAPDDAPAEAATSARNRFPGTVARVDRGEAVARVAIDVGARELLLALVTVDSAERLDLTPGRAVVASFKATATRATPIAE